MHHEKGHRDNYAKFADRVDRMTPRNSYGVYASMTNAQCAEACQTKTYPRLGNTWAHLDYDKYSCGSTGETGLNAQCITFGSVSTDDCTHSKN